MTMKNWNTPKLGRIKNVLLNLINNDQTGFMKGRFIGENVRVINSVVCFGKESNIPGLLLC